MGEKIKKYAYAIISIFLIIVLLLGTYTCKREVAHNKDMKQFDQTVAALNDSIQKVVNSKGDTVFVDRVVVGDLDDITNTEAFKKLSKEKQAYYLDLKKTKGLLAASQETIHKKDSLIALLTDTVGVRTDSTVCYDYGDKIEVPDTTVNRLTYSGDITFEREKVKLAIKYDYKVKISSKVIKYNKNGSVEIQHTLDDPNAKVIQGESYMVPAETKTTWQKIWAVTEKVLYGLGGLGTGYLVGAATK